NLSPAGPYDAIYLVAYAVFAVGDAELTGPSLSRAIGRLVPPGTPIEIGPSHMYEAFDVLRSGAKVDLQGAGSLLDYALRTGESQADYVVECVAADGEGRAARLLETGLRYSAAAKRLEGALACP